jgi:hypothetical protein
MFVTYLHTEFHLANSTESLIITIKPKAEYEFHAAAISFF